MGDSAWLANLLGDAELKTVPTLIAESKPSVRFVADDPSYDVLHAALSTAQISTERLIRARHFPVVLMLNFDIRHVVVVDSVNEDAARETLLTTLKAEKTPEPILATMRFETFVSDWLPRALTHTDFKSEAVDVLRDFPTVFYAIVSTPRSGSSFLAEMLSSMELGRPYEHLRPWLVRLVKERPEGLFDAIRFLQTLICLNSKNSIFGTKLMSYFVDSLIAHLTSTERSYLREFLARFKIIYLIREDKLDQAISSFRARQTGVWHASDLDGYDPLKSGDLRISQEDLSWEMGQRVIEESQLTKQMAELQGILVVTYDELVNDRNGVASKVSAYFGVSGGRPPLSTYIKLADAASDYAKAAYLANHPTRVSTLAVRDLLENARHDARRLQTEMERRSHSIREGHATSKAGDYQDRHYYLLDYKSTSIPGLVFPCRGPTPSNLDDGRYITFLGAAQTFGAFIHRPFPEQIGERLGREVLNLGRGGGGPSFFTALPRVMELVRGASAVVVQVMASRMISNSRFQSIEGRAAVHYLEADGSHTWMDCEQAWTRALAEGGAPLVRQLVEESQNNWMGAMRKIAETANAPTVMFYFSSVQPDHKIGFESLGSIYGEYPQLVTRSMVEAVRPAFAAYAEVVSTEGLPEPTVSSFSGEPLPVVFGGGTLDEQNVLGENTYYPSQPMHDQAADVLTEVLRPLLLQ